MRCSRCIDTDDSMTPLEPAGDPATPAGAEQPDGADDDAASADAVPLVAEETGKRAERMEAHAQAAVLGCDAVSGGPGDEEGLALAPFREKCLMAW